MTYPYQPGMPVYPVAYPQPFAPPPGHGVLVVTVNRGPYIVPATTTARLKIDGQTVAIPGEGTWHIAVAAGQHDVRYTDFMGIPAMTTHPLVVHPGTANYLSFRFGGWRNRVYDGYGTDVTKFGMWSNYTVMLITFAVIGILCCGGLFLIGALSSTTS